MASPFDSLTLATLQQHLQTATPSWAALNAAYLAGDHWQKSVGWVGPWPDALEPEAARVQAEIAKAFVAQNAIGEVVERHVGGVIGKEPAWGLTVRRPLKPGKAPTRAEQALIDEAEAALTSWWDKRKLLEAWQKATETLLIGGRVALRLFVPAGLRVGGVVPQAASVEAALDYCYLDRPALAAATVITDADTQQQCGIYAYQDAEGQAVAELTYVDLDTGKTVLRVLRQGADAAAEGGAWDLGRQLLIHEARRVALITEPVRRQQNQLNLGHTMSGRNIVQGGFLERIILGAQMPGDWVDDPAAPVGPDGTRKRFVARPFKVGAGRTNFISGMPIRDQAGKIVNYTTPSVEYRDPVETTTFEEFIQARYRAILGETRQLHALISGDSTASGASRVQARADFAKSLLQTKAQLDAQGRWLIEAALALASLFAGQPGRYAELRGVFDCRIDTGPLSADERQQIVAEVEKGVLSLETALAMLGHDDVDAELARIAAEKAARQAQAVEIAQPTNPTDPNAQGQGAQGEGNSDPPSGAQGGAQPTTQGGQ